MPDVFVALTSSLAAREHVWPTTERIRWQRLFAPLAVFVLMQFCGAYAASGEV